MNLTRADFGDFFAALHAGSRPFAWQERLLDSVLAQGRWPDLVVAPTGAGKTAVIDVHVFAQALTAGLPGDRPPRRLAMVVDRRVLVDDQFEYAQALALALADPAPVHTPGQGPRTLLAVAQALWSLHPTRPGENRAGASPLVLGRLRGGSPPSRRWRENPTAAAVICATPDMWGSRLLFRGYGSSPQAWPREAALLAVDAVVVVDEAHLARQLLCTARRVAELVTVAEQSPPARPLQVVETTATPTPAGGPLNSRTPTRTSVGVDETDLTEPLLAARLTRPKPVTLLPVPDWDATGSSPKVAERIADAVIALLPAATEPATGPSPDAPATARTVGCLVNTVARAIDVADTLRARTHDGRALSVVLVCGQTRPHDLDRLRQTHPGLLSPAGNDAVDVLVATQSLEVGVDLDLAGLVTELASGSALTQRAGRVNRRGLRPAGPVTVVVPQDGVSTRTRSGPYASPELAAALDWLGDIAAHGHGLAPWRLRDHTAPPAPARRLLYQRPELGDVWHWARTSDDLAAEPELDLWLAEDFHTDTSVGIVVREAMPVDGSDAVQLITDLPPRRHEVFPVPHRTAVAALRRPTPAPGEPSPAVVRVRGEDITLLPWDTDQVNRADEPRLRPGDVVVLDATWAGFTPSHAGDRGGFSPPVVIADTGNGGPLQRHATSDVLMATTPRDGNLVLRLEPGVAGITDEEFALLAKQLRAPDEDPTTEPDPGLAPAIVAEWLRQHPPRHVLQMAAAAPQLLTDQPRALELLPRRDPSGDLIRVLVIDRRRTGADEGLRQVCTPTGGHVTLDAHQAAVGDRARSTGESLTLPPPLVHALHQAGLHHDDGKADARFQTRLGHAAGPLLAKSATGTTWWQARRNERLSGLPARWRHEQRSAVAYWDTIHATPAAGTSHPHPADPDLVIRLVGTSHGHGRSGFPHASSELLTPTDPTDLAARAEQLFDAGRWDTLIEATQQRYGVWGCAYLEALLRAADGQVSEEGR
jgi:CRISPR-associated endonuclease/helicase Cas3